MQTRWLQDFLTLAETGNFTRAAALRNTSQTAFSRRIQALEAWLGATLIDRNVVPAQLTSEGERFRQVATGILQQLVEVRSELSGSFARQPDHIRIALPFALATSHLPDWWSAWTEGDDLAATLVSSNINDLATSLLNGSVDVMICFDSTRLPVALDRERFDRTVIATDRLRPYAARDAVTAGALSLPGTPDSRVPLLLYSNGIYFAHLVDQVLDATPHRLHGVRILESDMSDVLRQMALAGRGVAWLPESTLTAADAERLHCFDDPRWEIPLSTVAFRERTNRRSPVERLWGRLAPPV